MDSPSHLATRPSSAAPASPRQILTQAFFLLLVLLTAGYFRFTGLMWGDYQYQHPDERFLVWVVADIAPVDNLSQYFDTATSTLNPANRGHSFYVYGDFPVIITRYLTEQIFPQVGWMEILQVGRGLSAFLDLLTVLLVYLITRRIAGWKVATLAGFFSGAAVLQIQQAHFFTSDAFAVCFSTLVIYIGVLIATERDGFLPRKIQGRFLVLNLLFGAAVGLAMACKINTALAAGLLPVALAVHGLRLRPSDRQRGWLLLAGYAVASGAVAFLVFRLAQPYAFSGPGFLGVLPDQRWLASLRELRAQSSGDVDFPPALQWARRTHLFSFRNLMLYGVGLPLGITAWLGFFLYPIRVWQRARRIERRARADAAAGASASSPIAVTGDGFTGEPTVGLEALPPQAAGAQIYPSFASEPPLPAWLAALLGGSFPGVLLVWGWTGVYFTWQSLAWNPTMRYQLPIYPTLAVLAAWGLGSLWAHPPLRARLAQGGRGLWQRLSRLLRPRPWRTGVAVLGVIVLALTLAWAFAFTRIYNRTETRVAASNWIFANVPGPVNLLSGADGQAWTQLLPVSGQAMLRPGLPYTLWFDANRSGGLAAINLGQTQISGVGSGGLLLQGTIFDQDNPQNALATGWVALPPTGSVDHLDLPVNGLPALVQGKRYRLALALVGPQGNAGSIAPDQTGVTVNMTNPLALTVYLQAQTLAFLNPSGGMLPVTLNQDSALRQVRLPQGSNLSQLTIILQNAQTGEQTASVANRVASSASATAPLLTVDPALTLKAGQAYLIGVAVGIPGQTLDPNQPLLLDLLDQPVSMALPAVVPLGRSSDPLFFSFNARESGPLTRINLGYAAQEDPAVSGLTKLNLQLFSANDPSQPVAQASLQADLTPGANAAGKSVSFHAGSAGQPDQGYRLHADGWAREWRAGGARQCCGQ